ncbi:MAG: Cysteine--tRNA ligase [Mycoplasmataceae bacterium]|nr:MAG: Cysteine--tRNA ligase [Mycoplasmataceae bacterium]
MEKGINNKVKDFFTLRIYNSLERSTTRLNLQSNQAVNIYLCGPTVYDHIHIGNLRPVIIFDVLHRLLLNLKIKVNYIQNITDIDDKIIIRAQKENKSEREVGDYYTQSYFDNLIRYNALLPNSSPRVTNYISQIERFIAVLLEKKTAYQQDGEVIFRVSGNKEYGRLSGQDLTKLRSGVREINKVDKEDNKDFSLWKKTVEGVTWDSSWGKGRPGWHTECAVFINDFFQGQTIDIHGGGNDLLFPHHENERIQYLAHNNRELSRIWLHIAHIHWKDEKMSKSLGNVISAENFAQNYDTNAFRYLILNTNYSQVINLSEELINQATDYIQKIKNLNKKLKFYLYQKKLKVIEQENYIRKEIISSLLDNLNTVKSLYFLEQIITSLNRFIDQNDDVNLQKNVGDFYFVINLLGFKFDFSPYESSTGMLIDKWQELRNVGDYQRADKIRKQLQELEVI